MSTHERASLVPAAAVIPALIVYRIIVAVKKFVVGFSTVWRSSLTRCTFSSVCTLFTQVSEVRITLNGLSAQGESSD